MKNGILIITLLFAIFNFYCSKNDNPISPIDLTKQNTVYIINEGNFMKGNASISLYLIDSNKVYDDIFYKVNAKKIGDVAQNMYIKDGKGYIIVNNSNKIVIIDITTNKLIDTISNNLVSPRSICFYGNKMYVSNLYSSSISVFTDTNYKTFVKSIPTNNNPDEMLLMNSKIYCLHPSGFSSTSQLISIIDPATDKVSKVIKTGFNPTQLKSTPSGNIVVLCSGEYFDYANPNDDIFAKLYLLNSTTDLVYDSIFVGSHPWDFAIESDDNAYVIGDAGIMKVNLKQKNIDNNSFIAGYYYSIAYEPIRKELYLGDAKDYNSNGEVSIYDLSGNMRKKFSVGLIPGAFCFNMK